MLLAKKNYPMKSDVREKKDTYVLEVDLPGFQKEDIKAYVKDSYLILSASQSKENKKEDGRFIHQERYSGAIQRSFYIGSQICQEDIKASYKHGVLKLIIPKNGIDGNNQNGKITIL